jgi:hypothetical protein
MTGVDLAESILLGTAMTKGLLATGRRGRS